MRVTANNVRPGDRVRGIGLVAEFVEPQTDFATHIEGKVGHDGSTVHLVLPNDHQVRVVRPFAEGDIVTVPSSVFGPEFMNATAIEPEGDEDADEDGLVSVEYTFPAVIVTAVHPDTRSIEVQTEYDGFAGQTAEVAFRLARHAA